MLLQTTRATWSERRLTSCRRCVCGRRRRWRPRGAAPRSCWAAPRPRPRDPCVRGRTSSRRPPPAPAPPAPAPPAPAPPPPPPTGGVGWLWSHPIGVRLQDIEEACRVGRSTDVVVCSDYGFSPFFVIAVQRFSSSLIQNVALGIICCGKYHRVQVHNL